MQWLFSDGPDSLSGDWVRQANNPNSIMAPGVTPVRDIVQAASHSRRVDNQAGFFGGSGYADSYADFSFGCRVEQQMINGHLKIGIGPDQPLGMAG